VCDELIRLGRRCRGGVDAALALISVAVAAGALTGLPIVASSSAVAVVAATLLSYALLAWRRRYPVSVAVATGALIAVPEFTHYATAVNNSDVLTALGIIAVFLYAYALGARARAGPALLGLASLIAAVNLTTDSFNPLVEMITIGPWIGGLVVASRRRLADELEIRARQLDEERDVFARQSVRYERARIARELHDIVAHCVSLMVVQASAGQLLARHDPRAARQAFESISEAARQAEVEIDRLVELLDTSSPAAPSAGLRIVDELVRRVQASGLTIACQFSGDSDDLSEPAAEAAYRVVQESITNAMKHAPGGAINISVRGRADAVVVEVVNQPAIAPSSGIEGLGGGHGLAGMEERVRRCGGKFDAAATSAGGWRVWAALPRHAPSDTRGWGVTGDL
jgi:signal transduction histidine kinase